MSSTESRLAAVERQLRFHRAVIATLLVALVALVGYGATEEVPDVIRAKRFVVIGPRGRELAELSSLRGIGMLEVLTAGVRNGAYSTKITGGTINASCCIRVGGTTDANARVTVGTTESGGWVVVKNRNGDEVVHIHADEYGMGYVGVFDRQGKGRTLTPR